MDLENKPNMIRTRIGGGYMVVGYSCGGSIWIQIGGGIWIRIQSGGGEAVVVDGRAMIMVRRRHDNL